MIYTRPLPSMRSLKQLASSDGPFPTKSYHMVVSAEQSGFGADMLAFLNLFPHDEAFLSREDFLQKCQELEIAIYSERELPVKELHSLRS